MNKVILIDFDGTIVRGAFPEIGKPMPMAFEVMKELKEAGWKLILWTCREDEGYNINRQYLTEAVRFCKENGVDFDAVNEAIPELDFRCDTCKKRKPYADVVVDNKNLGGFPGWEVVRKMLIETDAVIRGGVRRAATLN
jgi:histidinol phosphatase-like enzyme